MKSLKHILLFCCCFILSVEISKSAQAGECPDGSDPAAHYPAAPFHIYGEYCPSGWASAISDGPPPSPGQHCGIICSSPPPAIDGVCGSDANTCSEGTASGYSAGSCDGYQTWSCDGSGGGSTASCAIANAACGVVNGSCGGSANTCSSGSASGYDAGSCDGYQTWSCDGSGGGSTASCSIANAACSAPVNGTCGTANGGQFYTPPTTNLCDLGDGIATPAPTGTGPHPHSWTWTCGGSGGGSASPPCTATQKYDGVCGSSHYQFLTSEPTTNLCAPGFTASAVTGTGPWTWSCAGLNTGLTTNCSSRIAVNGSCGTANGVARSSAPSANLCGAGVPSSVTGTGPWNWTCDGTGVGTKSASCSAPLPPPPPSFGGACP